MLCHASKCKKDPRGLKIVVMSRPLDSGAASSAACRQGKRDIGGSQKKKGKKEDKHEDEGVIKGGMMVEE